MPLRTTLAYSTYPTLCDWLPLHSSRADNSLSYWQIVPSSYPLHSDRSRAQITWNSENTSTNCYIHCPSTRLSLCFSFCFSSCIRFCSSLLQSTLTFEPRWQRDAQPNTNQFQVAPAHTTLGQHENELSLSPPKLNNASWGYHSVSTPVGLGEVLHEWSLRQIKRISTQSASVPASASI